MEFHFNTSFDVFCMTRSDRDDKRLDHTDVNIHLTMSCREHIFHCVHGISIESLNKQKKKQQPEFITRKSQLIFLSVFFSQNADANWPVAIIHTLCEQIMKSFFHRLLFITHVQFIIIFWWWSQTNVSIYMNIFMFLSDKYGSLLHTPTRVNWLNSIFYFITIQ